MNPYLLTVTFLMLMSILTSTEVARFADASIERKIYTDYLETTCKADRKQAVGNFENFRQTYNKHEKPTPPPEPGVPKEVQEAKQEASPVPLRVDEERPPNNSRLNFYRLLYEPQPSSGFSLYETAAELIRLLYRDAPFFRDVSGGEYRILNSLMEKKEEARDFSTPDELTTLALDEETQTLFYKMMKGEEGFPSLLHFITFDKPNSTRGYKKINLMYAPTEILACIFKNPRLLEEVVCLRNRLWREIRHQEEHRKNLVRSQSKGRKVFSEELTTDFKAILNRGGMDEASNCEIFDFSLNKPGSVIFIKNKDLVFRQLHTTPVNKKQTSK